MEMILPQLCVASAQCSCSYLQLLLFFYHASYTINCNGLRYFPLAALFNGLIPLFIPAALLWRCRGALRWKLFFRTSLDRICLETCCVFSGPHHPALLRNVTIRPMSGFCSAALYRSEH